MKTYHIAKRSDSEWAVVREKAVRAASVHSTRKEAQEAAEELAAANSGVTFCGQCQRGVVHEISPADLVSSKIAPSSHKPTLAERIGNRVKRARIMRGLSLRDLSGAIQEGVSHTTLQKIERGGVEMDTELLGLLSRALSVRPDYFLQPDRMRLQGVEYRKQNSKLGKKAQLMVEEQAFEFFERYLEAEKILELPTKEFPKFDLSEFSVDLLSGEIEKVASRLRKQWHLGANPVSNVHAILEENGVKVKIMEARKGFDGFSAFAANKNLLVPVIALGEVDDLARLRFSALHELGHLCMKLPPELEAREVENACHRFAAAFLLPKDAITLILGKRRKALSMTELAAIKQEWGISVGAILHRTKNLQIITESRHKGYCIAMSKKGYRTKEPSEWDWRGGNEESSRFQNLVLRALSEGYVTPSKACGLLEINLPELAKLSEPFA